MKRMARQQERGTEEGKVWEFKGVGGREREGEGGREERKRMEGE